MSKGNAFETAILDHVLNNANIANIGDATGLRGSTVAGSLYVSLHESDPGEAGTQTTGETDYPDYARVAVARDGSVWTVASGAAENAVDITFPACSGGSPQTVTHFGIGVASSGSGMLLYKGQISGSGLVVGNGVTPRFPAGAFDGSED